MESIRLTERATNWHDQVEVNRPLRLVRNVALAGPASRNGYRYSETSLQAAVPLYENKPVFLDHAANRQRPLDRGTRDLVGTIINCQFVDGRIRGDIRVLQTESGETFLNLVQSDAPGVGMSHVVLARRSADGKSVEEISEVLSVDVVINPATTQTFRESLDPENQFPADLASQLTTLQQERDQLRSERDSLKQKIDSILVRERVREMITRSGLTPELVSDCFQEQLIHAENDLARQRLIEDRLALLPRSPRRSLAARSSERLPADHSANARDEFLRVLRRR